MRVYALPIFEDNYAFLIVDQAQGVCAAVDPADPTPVLELIHAKGLTLTRLLITHHHHDHAGGINAFLLHHPTLEVLSGADPIPGVTRRLSHGEAFTIGALEGEALSTPCHTRGHVAFHVEGALFCGDTLFVGGCGRFFEGTAAQMDAALNQTFAALPDETLVYCAHEYTCSNLRFARRVDPENPALRAKLAWAEARRAQGLPTIPSTLGEERAYNPFMRVREAALQRATGEAEPLAVMAKLRALKNQG